MSGVASITGTKFRMKQWFWILLIIAELVWMHGYAVPSSERHTLILANEDMGVYLHVLELLPTGEIVTTGQDFDVGGSFYEEIGVSPDSRFVWCGAYVNGEPGNKQFGISSEGQLSTTGRIIEQGGVNIKFTPNGQMLLITNLNTPIYSVYPDGSVESTANFYSTGGHISPRGDIDLWLASPVYVEKIDYSGFSVYNIQAVTVDGGATPYDAAYTPEGDYVAIVNRGGSLADIDIYPILTDGSLDTTQVQSFDMGTNAHSDAISHDGKYIYVGYDDQLYIAII